MSASNGLNNKKVLPLDGLSESKVELVLQLWSERLTPRIYGTMRSKQAESEVWTKDNHEGTTVIFITETFHWALLSKSGIFFPQDDAASLQNQRERVSYLQHCCEATMIWCSRRENSGCGFLAINQGNAQSWQQKVRFANANAKDRRGSESETALGDESGSFIKRQHLGVAIFKHFHLTAHWQRTPMVFWQLAHHTSDGRLTFPQWPPMGSIIRITLRHHNSTKKEEV